MTNLENIIAAAARQAFTELFATHPERFYYCSLVTSGDATRPATAAWSLEALAAAVSSGAPSTRRTSTSARSISPR